jgi:uncharacterized protein (DUF58 family)
VRRARVLLILWAIVLAAAVSTGKELLFRLHWLMFAILVLSLVWTWLNIRGIQLGRHTRTRRIQVGQIAEEQFAVRNTNFLPRLWLEVRDWSDLPNHWASRVVNSLGPKRQRSWSIRTYCRRRGQFVLGPITLASGDPLGLFRLERHFPATSTIIVYPMTINLPGFEPPFGRLTGSDVMRRQTHYITTNVVGVRDYAPGDSFNRIHWPSSTRTGRLMVKQFEMDPTADIWLVLDMDHTVQVGDVQEELTDSTDQLASWIPGTQFNVDPTTEEYGVTVAASLAKHFLDQNRSVGIIAYGHKREVVQLDRGERQATKILEMLAVIQAEGRASLEQVIVAEGRSFDRNTTLVVVTASTEEGWIGTLRDLRRRGVRTVVVLLEASTFGPAPSSLNTVSSLASNAIPTYLIKCGEPIDEALRHQTELQA